MEQNPHRANEIMLKGPPIYFSPFEGHPGRMGTWVVTRAKQVKEIYLDPGTFSSKGNAALSRLLDEDWDLIPSELDPPAHGKYRLLLAPFFTPARLAEMEIGIRSEAVKLIGIAVDRGKCDFEASFGRPFPVSIFLRLVGLPVDRLSDFMRWSNDMLHGSSLEQVKQGARSIRDYIGQIIEERRRCPGPDLLSVAITARVDGKPLDDAHVIGMCMLMFVAGLDTITSALDFAVKHLAENQDHQERLRNDPAVIPRAVEEFLRAYSTVSIMRIVARDVDFYGVPMKRGDRVLLAGALAGRDPDAWNDPDQIDFDRKPANHLAFGTGPHMCIGMNLARRELNIALSEWLARIPTFRLDPESPPITHARGVWGIDRLPLLWRDA